MKIATGIDSRAGISVQEYWLKDSAHYAVSNRHEQSITLTVCEWRSGASGDQIAGPWVCAPGTVATFPMPAPQAADGSLWALVRENGEIAGRLRPPIAPDATLAVDKTRVITNDGLNGTGEKLREVWCAQDALWYSSGESVDVEWHVPASQRTLRLSIGGVETSREQAAIRAVSCDSLAMEISGGQAVIDVGKVQRERAAHDVRLSIDLPAVTVPTLVPIEGRISIEGGGAFPFQRGILVRPQKELDE